MGKFKLILGYIFTFGILYIVLRQRLKKHVASKNKQLTVSTKIPFTIDDLLAALGTKENIITYNSTITTLKVEVKSKPAVNIDHLKKLGTKGVMWGNNQSLILVIGDFAPTVVKELDAVLT